MKTDSALSYFGADGEKPSHRVLVGDCLSLMREMPDNSVDLVLCSPPYCGQRDYGIGFNLTGQDWVDWAIERYIECLRVSRGLVAWVVEGNGQQTVNYSGEPILMQAELIRRGIPIWKPSIYGRWSLPGRFTVLRNIWEFVVCSSGGKQLEWSDPTACGGPPKCAPGGRTRPRNKDGSRNVATTGYVQPARTNYGNIVWCGPVGGGQMGSPLATLNEAPFPEFLADVFVQSFCKPGGTVLDCYCGSGTTLAVALRNGRNAIGMDVRESQRELTERRIAEAMNKHQP